MSDGAPVRFAVVGADHLHLFSLVAGLLRAGARPAAHTADGDLLGGYERWQSESERRDLRGVLEDVDIDLVVTAGVPSERAASPPLIMGCTMRASRRTDSGQRGACSMTT